MFLVTHHRVSEADRLFFAVGFAGGLTTFSTFGIETDILWRHRRWLAGLLYILASVLGGLCAFRLGALGMERLLDFWALG